MTGKTAPPEDLAAAPVPSEVPATGSGNVREAESGDVSAPALTLLGSSDAVVCEGDTCWIPPAVD